MSSARSALGRRASRINRPTVLALEGRTLLTASPRIDTFAVPSIESNPEQIINGPDGDLWFTELGLNIGRITPQGQVTEFPLPTPAGGTPTALSSLTAGSDGAIWAIDEANQKVDRIAVDGQVESFAIPGVSASGGSNASGSSSSNSPTSQLGSIVAGADGNLWFSTIPSYSNIDSGNPSPATQPGTIDRITPQGVVTQFSLPLGGGAAESLAAGPDGIWFTDPSANRIGEIDFSGHVVEFGAPTPGGIGPGANLAVGPDGDAYFVTAANEFNQEGANNFAQPNSLGPSSFIVKVTPAGAMTTTTVPGDFLSLLAGSDGIYIVGSDAGNDPQLERLGPDGTLTPIAAGPAFSAVTSLAFGPDGNLWFIENGEAVIGRMVLAPTPVPEPGPTLVGAGLASSPGTGTGEAPNYDIITPDGQATLLTLAGFSHSADVSGVSATVNWGDGSATTTGTIGPAPSSLFEDTTASPDPFVEGQVSGTHDYARAGLYPVTVTLQGTGPGGTPITTEVAVTVSAVDPSPSPVSPPLVLQAAKTIAFQGAVAEFSTPTPHDASGSDFTATIDWGDGSATTAGTIVGGSIQTPPTPPAGVSAGSNFIVEPTGPCNDFQVSGGHTYATAGTYTVKVTLTDQFGNSSTASTPIQVIPEPLTITPTNPAVSTVYQSAEDAFTGSFEYPLILGTLTDYQGSLPGRAYAVTVNWGDGSGPGSGMVVPQYSESGSPTAPDPTFSSVEGDHVYAKPGDYTITYTVNDYQGDIVEGTTTYQTPAPPPAITLTPVPYISNNTYAINTVGDPLAGVSVASIALPDPNDSASNLTATINWGDGSATTTGTIGQASQPGFGTPGVLFVNGTHTYTAAGLYVVTITVNGPGGLTAQATNTVSEALPNVQDGSPTPTIDFTQGVASPPMALANIYLYVANGITTTVNWGDGSPNQSGTLVPDSSSGSGEADYSIVGGHDYAQAGTYTVTVTAVGADGLPDVMTSQATVTAPPPAVVVSPVVVANPTPPTPTPTPTPSPIALPEPSPIPTPTPTPILTPMPVVSSSVPRSMALPFAVVLPSPFPRFAPAVKPSAGSVGPIPKPTRHAPSRLTDQHVEAKPVHVALPKKQPAAPARLAKRPG